MRKYFFLVVVFLVFCFASNAQKFTVTNNQSVMIGKSGKLVNFMVAKSGKLVNTEKKQNDYIGFDGTFHYFIVDEKTLLKADESLKNITSIKLDNKFESEFLTNFYSEGIAGLLSVRHNKNDFVIEKMTVDSKGLNESTLLTVSGSEGDYYDADFASSPDKKIKMIALTIVSWKDEYKSTFIFVVDNQGDVLWSENFSPDFNDKKFYFSDMCVDNDGSVYVLATSYTEKVKKCNLHLFKLNKKEDIEGRESFPFEFNRIGSTKLLVLSNGNIFAGGYYTETEYYNYHNSATKLGTFSYVFDGQTLEKLKYKTKTLEGNLPKSVTLKQAYSDDMIKYVKGIFETTDQKITMIAEEKGGGYSKNIYIQSFDLDGNYQNSDILYKKQFLYNVSNWHSFDVLVNGDELILLYNDNSKNNIFSNTPNVKDFKSFAYKSGQTVACVVKNGIVGKKQIVIDAKAEQRIYFSLAEQFDNKEAIVRVQTGMAGTGPITLETIGWQ
ncbi:MAG: hypothetical protein FWD66_04425 [Paludibacter sp.]|nr:hypothetical protein [Paludibacter sp.]